MLATHIESDLRGRTSWPSEQLEAAIEVWKEAARSAAKLEELGEEGSGYGS